MDWTKLKEKALWFKDKAIQLKDQTLDKAKELWSKAADKTKELWSKAADFTSDTISKIPVALKILADFEKVKNDKLLVILFFDKETEDSKKMILQIPLIIKDAWINWATFKTIDIIEAKELTTNFNITKTPCIIVYQNWEETKKIDVIEDINKFLKDFKI